MRCISISNYLRSASSEWYWTYLDYAHDPMVIANAEGIILWVNRAFTRVTGYEREVAVGHSTRILKSGVQGVDFYESFWKSLILTGHWSGEIWNRRQDGSLYREWLEIYPIEMPGGNRYYFTVFQEITTEKDMLLDIQVAGKLQKSLAPDPLYQSDRVRIRTVHKGLYSVTGDLYDYFWLQDRVLFGYVADVMGHGVSAAMQVGAMRVLIRETIQQAPTLGEAMNRLNQSANFYLANETFAAALCFVLDFDTMKFRYVSAGIHTFFHHDGEQLHKIQVESTYLGISNSSDFQEHIILVKPGDTLYLMTDGLYDLLVPSIREFPIQIASMHDDFEKFLSQYLVQDDITLMTLELF